MKIRNIIEGAAVFSISLYLLLPIYDLWCLVVSGFFGAVVMFSEEFHNRGGNGR